MLKEYLSDHSVLPVAVMLIFLIAFIIFIVLALRTSKSKLDRYSRIPLEDNIVVDPKQTSERIKNV